MAKHSVYLKLAVVSVCILISNPAAQNAKVILSPDVIHPLNPRVFGHFMERPSWGNEWGIEHAVQRKTQKLDPRVIESLKGMELPVIRFPGGTDVDYMDWTDMIDLPERTKRPISTGHAGDAVANRFGIDEFGELCAELDTEVIIVLNFFEAFLKWQPLDTAALHITGLVAYANADTGKILPAGMRDWPSIRAENGHPDPFKFKYVQIGNETWALWSWKKQLLEQAGIEQPYEWYVQCLTRYIDLIESIDPEVEIIVDYVNNDLLQMVHSALGDRIDYYVFHTYMPWAMNNSNVKKDGQTIDPAQLSQEEVWNAFVSVPNNLDANYMSTLNHGLISQAKNLDLKIAVTEWNWNGWWENVANPPLSSYYAQGVGAAGYLHGLARRGDVIEIGCQSMLVGSSWGINSIRVDFDEAHDPYYHPTGQMTSFYAANHGDYYINAQYQNIPLYTQPLKMNSIRAKDNVAEIDVLATASQTELAVFFINRNFSSGHMVDLDMSAFGWTDSIAVHSIISGVLNNDDVNPPIDVYQSVHDTTIRVENKQTSIRLPARSVSVFKLKVDQLNAIDQHTQIVKEFSLVQNYPNPFNAETLIEFRISKSAHIKLELFNINGQIVRTLVNEQLPPGNYSSRWDGRDNQGRATASGVYFYRLTYSGRAQTKKMLKLD